MAELEVRTTVVAPAVIADSAVPASASFTGDAPPRPRAAMPYTRHAATTAPAKAYQTWPPKPFARPRAIP
ncbi:hypothetical protein ADK35_03500 [Streptomyces viridochromogenes]|nr:hypothetical protein ADK35_03500 [Streptomyces viridochromogenes]